MIVEAAFFSVGNYGPVILKGKLNMFLNFPFMIADLNCNLKLKAVESIVRDSHQGMRERNSRILSKPRTGFKKNNDT